ncbi:MAG: thiolase domain-containing protein [Candidatus Syntropharchaeia archaeon]
MRKVYIIGIGMTPFGEIFDKDVDNLVSEAFFKALDDANLEQKDIEAVWAGTMLFHKSVPGPLVARATGLVGKPVSRMENACAAGTDIVRNAFFAVGGGYYDIVAVVGFEKMRDVTTTEMGFKMAIRSPLYEQHLGMTGPGNFAMFATRHMHEYGTTSEQLAMVAVKNHKNGAKNPNAQFRREITIEQVLNGPIISWPLHLLDCCAITDGAVSLVLASEDVARKYTDTLIEIAGVGLGTDYSLHAEKKTLTEFAAVKYAANQAYRMAKVEPKDIDVAETHDCFTISEIIEIEDLGFTEKGNGGKFTEEGETEIGGKIPVNTSGGLKACGHPIGATGTRQIHDMTEQLRGEAGERQVDGAEIALTQTLGAQVNISGVCILKRA